MEERMMIIITERYIGELRRTIQTAVSHSPIETKITTWTNYVKCIERDKGVVKQLPYFQTIRLHRLNILCWQTDKARLRSSNQIC